MLFLVMKYAVTALVVVVVSGVAKRSDRAGALIASLPLVALAVTLQLKGGARCPQRAFVE